MDTKLIFVTGGVVSSLGKGIIGQAVESKGLQRIDYEARPLSQC